MDDRVWEIREKSFIAAAVAKWQGILRVGVPEGLAGNEKPPEFALVANSLCPAKERRTILKSHV